MDNKDLNQNDSPRPIYRKIADWLVLLATMALTLMPFVSFARVDYILDPNSFNLGGGFFHFFYRTIRAFFSLKDMPESSDLYYLICKYMGMFLCVFFFIYALVQMIISLVAIVLTIIRAVKGDSCEIVNKANRLVVGTMALGIFFTLFSNPCVSFRYSVLMQITFLFALLLIFASMVICAIGNRKFVFQGKQKIALFIKDSLFLLTGLSVFLLCMFMSLSDYPAGALSSFDLLTSSSATTGFTTIYVLFAYLIIWALSAYLIIPTTDQVKQSTFKLLYDKHVKDKARLFSAKVYTHPIAECVISGILSIFAIVNLILGVGNFIFLGLTIALTILCFLTSAGTIACYIIGKNPKKKN